jgi:hypothetical protein
MSDAGAAAAQRYREERRSKAARLGGGEDAVNVDASDFTPGEPLDADAKTGMRPVSRQARKRGGGVQVGMSPGPHALARPGRKPRKAGGGVGIDYVNRNAKAANQDRAGEKHDLGLKRGGRSGRAVGGAGGAPAVTLEGRPRASRKMGFAGGQSRFGLNRHSTDALHSMAESETDPTRLSHLFDEIDRRSGRRRGGRTARATGGRAASNDESVYQPRKERAGAAHTRELTEKSASAAEVDVPKKIVRASGGRVGRADGGPLGPPLSAGMGGQGRMNFNYGPQTSEASKLGLRDGGRARAHERYGAGPGPAEHHPGMAGGGRAGYAYGGAAPGPAEDIPTSDAGPLGAPGPGEHKGAVGQESFRHRSPRGENSSRARTLAAAKARAEGGKVGEGALKQHRAEHKAMGAPQHPKDCTCPKCSGGAVKRARGGRSGKGKMNVNIVIGTPGGMSQPPGGPPGPNPQLAIRPPPPPMPMPMPPPGAPPPGAMPMPMPAPPMAGPPGMPPGMPPMPPRARGGRAPKVGGEPEAGSGSGLGRLQKTAAYGHRSRDREGLRN